MQKFARLRRWKCWKGSDRTTNVAGMLLETCLFLAFPLLAVPVRDAEFCGWMRWDGDRQHDHVRGTHTQTPGTQILALVQAYMARVGDNHSDLTRRMAACEDAGPWRRHAGLI